MFSTLPSPLRRMPLVAASVGVAPDWMVAFNVPGVGLFEPAFANLVPRPRQRQPRGATGRGEPRENAGSPEPLPPAAMGVVYRMRAADWPRLKASEGSGLPGGAMEVTIDVQVPAAGIDDDVDTVAATAAAAAAAAAAAPPVTLRVRSLVWPTGRRFPAPPLLPAWAAGVVRPSERYLRLLRDGAAAWGIPADFVAEVYGEGRNSSAPSPSFRPPPPLSPRSGATGSAATAGRSARAEARRRDRRSSRPPPRQILPAVASSLEAVALARRETGGGAPGAAAAGGGVDFGLLFSPWRRVGDGPGGGAELVQGMDFKKGVDLRLMAPGKQGGRQVGGALDKRLLVFLPGIDGTGMSIVSQLDDLEAEYDVRCLVVPRANRSGWPELIDTVIRLIEAEVFARRRARVAAATPNAEAPVGGPTWAAGASDMDDVLLVGESMGGCFTFAVANELTRRREDAEAAAAVAPAVANAAGVTTGTAEKGSASNGAATPPAAPEWGLHGLVVINPATSFGRAALAPVWTTLAGNLPEDVYRAIIGPVLLPLVFDGSSVVEQLSKPLADAAARLGLRTARQPSSSSSSSNRADTRGTAAPDATTPDVRTALDTLLSASGLLSRAPELLPNAVVAHRVRLLTEYTLSADDYLRIGRAAPHAAVIACVNDLLLPSASEAVRLEAAIPGLKRCMLPHGGHTPLQDYRVNLRALLAAATTPVSPSVRDLHPDAATFASSDRVAAFRDRIVRRGWASTVLPRSMSATEQEALMTRYAPLRTWCDPVVIGLEHLPVVVPGGPPPPPVLFVCNHTLVGTVDAALVADAVYKHTGVLVRSLAHPALLDWGKASPGTQGGATPASAATTPAAAAAPRSRQRARGNAADTAVAAGGAPGDKPTRAENVAAMRTELQSSGVTTVSPRALTGLLASGQWALLFPGGAREALKRRSDAKYSLRWPVTPEFIRTAAATGALIVPVSTVGTEDMAQVVVDAPEVAEAIRLFNRFKPSIGRGKGGAETAAATGARARKSTTGTAVTADVGVPVADAVMPSVEAGFRAAARVPGAGAKAWRGAVTNEDDETELVPPLAVPTAVDRLYVRFGVPLRLGAAALDDRAATAAAYETVREAVAGGVEELLDRRERDAYRSPASRAALGLGMRAGLGGRPGTGGAAGGQAMSPATQEVASADATEERSADGKLPGTVRGRAAERVRRLGRRVGTTVAAGGGVATPAWAWTIGGKYLDADGFPVDVVE
ncbi:hypothetical protein MMPV_003416 [Pyropia vietnamensis]